MQAVRLLQLHLLSKGHAQMQASQKECCCQAGQLCFSSVSGGRLRCLCLLCLSFQSFFWMSPKTCRVYAWHSWVSTHLLLCQRPAVQKKKKRSFKKSGMKRSLHLSLCHPLSALTAWARGRCYNCSGKLPSLCPFLHFFLELMWRKKTIMVQALKLQTATASSSCSIDWIPQFVTRRVIISNFSIDCAWRHVCGPQFRRLWWKQCCFKKETSDPTRMTREVHSRRELFF